MSDISWLVSLIGGAVVFGYALYALYRALVRIRLLESEIRDLKRMIAKGEDKPLVHPDFPSSFPDGGCP